MINFKINFYLINKKNTKEKLNVYDFNIYIYMILIYDFNILVILVF